MGLGARCLRNACGGHIWINREQTWQRAPDGVGQRRTLSPVGEHRRRKRGVYGAPLQPCYPARTA